jgi:hypothetical protein
MTKYMDPVKYLQSIIPQDEQTRELEAMLERIIENVDNNYGSRQHQTVPEKFRFIDQMCAAIIYTIEHSSSDNTATQIIKKFDELLALKGLPEHKSHSIGIEIEFGAHDEDGYAEYREVRLRPYNDAETAQKAIKIAHELTTMCSDEAMSTLHLNFGLTQPQIERVVFGAIIESTAHGKIRDVEDTYRAIAEKVAYLSNNAPRNLKIAKKIYQNTYYTPYQGRNDQTSLIKSDVIQNSELPPDKQQSARLEFKRFSLSHEGDLAMINAFIPAMWKAIDNKTAAKELNSKLNTLFKEAEITPLRKSIEEARKAKSFAKNESRYIIDFGTQYLDGEGTFCAGRQMAYRPAVTGLLRNFVAGKSAIPRELYPSAEELAAYKEFMQRFKAPKDETWVTKVASPRQPETEPRGMS